MGKYADIISKSWILGVYILIFVTLGTQDKTFERLLYAVEKEANKGILQNEEIIVQAGQTKFESQNMKIYNLLDIEVFEKFITSCDLLITHGGVGSIIDGLKHHKKIIAAARLYEYKEHTNDHQKQIVDNFADEGYILKLEDFSKLDEVIKQAKNFKPKKFIFNNDHFTKKLRDYIDNN